MFNRRATRGKVNPPMPWGWSNEPLHEPLIPKWMFDVLAAARQAERGSRDDDEKNVHPIATRTYLLRGMVFEAPPTPRSRSCDG